MAGASLAPMLTRVPPTPRGRCPLADWLAAIERFSAVSWERFTALGALPEAGTNPIVDRAAATCTPLPPEGVSATPSSPATNLNVRVAELIAAATSDVNLARMPPGWESWL